MSKKRYQGSCACGQLRFEADIDFAQGTHKCNCTQCWKRRWWSVKVQPGDFRLLSGDEVVDRDFEVCPGCQVITHRHVPAAQWNPQDYVSVNVATLDDLPPADAAGTTVSVRLAATDYGRDPITGVLVGTTPYSLTVARDVEGLGRNRRRSARCRGLRWPSWWLPTPVPGCRKNCWRPTGFGLCRCTSWSTVSICATVSIRSCRSRESTP